MLLPTDHPPWPSDTFSRAQLIDMFNSWRPEAGEVPSKQRVYSHAGYVLLQLVLERCYGAPISTLFEQRILKPIGMNAISVPERGEDSRAVMDEAWMQRAVQGYSDQGMAIGPIGDQQSYLDFPGTGQMFPRRATSRLRCGLRRRAAVDPHLREALRMTQQEIFRVDEKFGQGMAWETVRLPGVTVVDKPGGLNNASGYIGLVPAQRIGIVLLANRGEYPHEIARYKILPALAHLVTSH